MMRRRTPRIALVVVFTTTFVLVWASTGQTDDDKSGEVSIQPVWKIGDKQRYERINIRRRTVNGKETDKSSARGPIDISVVESGEKGFLMRWRIGETTPDDPKAAADPNVRAMSGLVEGLEVDIELDNEATITGVRNWTEMKARAAKIAEAVLKAQEAAGADAKTLAAVKSTIETMFATKERVEQVFTKEPHVFFLPVGRVYPGIGKPIEYDDHLPNPLGGPPFPCKGKFTLASYDRAKGRAVVAWTQTADPEETARILVETMKALSQRMGRTLPNADELKTLSIKDSTEFVIDTHTGWIEQFTHTRSSTTQGSSQEDILSMTRQTRPR